MDVCIGIMRIQVSFLCGGDTLMIAIYARQSVDKKDSLSIEDQIERCKAEIGQESYRVYKDKGYSGKNLDRKEFPLMMNDIRAGIISKVVVYRLDRISRSVLDFANIYAVLEEYGVEFVSCNEKFDTSLPHGKAMLDISMVFAELERKTIQQRVIDAYASRSRAGFYMGGRIPYGFTKKQTTLGGIKTSQYVPEPLEIEQIRTIFEMYSKPATSLADIVRYLKANNIKKTRGIEWSSSRLTETLRNPIYVRADMDLYNFYKSRGTEIVNDADSFIGTNGCYLYTKDVNKIVGSTKNMAHYENMVLVLAPHEGIVDSDTFIRCRLKAEQNVQIPNGRRSHTTWVSGKLKCIKCGYAMRYNKWEGKTTENEYYLCSAVNSKKCDGVGAVHKHTIESVVLEQLKEKIKSIKVEQTRPNTNQSEINKLKALITTKESEIDKILDNFKYASQTIIERMNEEVESLAEEIKELENQIFKLEYSKNETGQIDTDSIEKIFKHWDSISKEDKAKVVDILITKVLVSKEKIEIEWKI
jgi:DNA invertase Pin-like site-specific DNA recombinase